MKRISITIGTWAMLGIAPVRALTCQRIEALRAGDAIRVSVSPGKQIEGKLVSISADTIVLRGPAAPIPIAFSSIALLQVKRRSGKSFTRSVVIGFLGGAVGTALVGLFSGSTNTGDGTITAMDKATIGLVAGGAAGLIGGSVYGACCSSGWEPVPWRISSAVPVRVHGTACHGERAGAEVQMILPSGIRRLTLHDIRSRGKRFEVVVESDSLRMIERK